MGTRLKLLKETATVTVLSLSAAHVYMMYNALAIRIIQTALLAAGQKSKKMENEEKLNFVISLPDYF